MDRATNDLHEMLHMVALLKGAASRAVFADCAVIFLGVAEMLERQALAIAAGERDAAPAPSASPPPARQPINIMA